MGKTNIDMTGRINLLVGFRFRPTDEKLVVHYLARKVFGFPLPASIIAEFDVFQTDPWRLPGDLNERRYFFSRKSRNGSGNKFRRSEAGSASWKRIGKVKLIENNKVAGTRKTLVFCETQASHPQTRKTRWFLREYGFVGTPSIPSSNLTSEVVTEEDWVIHCLFKKRRRPTKRRCIYEPPNAEGLKVMWPRMMAITAQDDEYGRVNPPQPCSSCSSVITEVCVDCEAEEESCPFTSFS